MASEAKPSSRRAQTRQVYLEAVEGAFGADVDHAMLNKIYGGLVRERQGPLQPRRLHRDQDTGCHRKAGHGACLYVLRRAVKSHNADAQPAFCTGDECVLQKIREPRHMVAIWAIWCNFIRVMPITSNATISGAAAEHYIMCQLLRRNTIAALAPSGVPDMDIIVSDRLGSSLAAIQFKARREIGADGGWHMKKKHETIIRPLLFLLFRRLWEEPYRPPLC